MTADPFLLLKEFLVKKTQKSPHCTTTAFSHEHRNGNDMTSQYNYIKNICL